MENFIHSVSGRSDALKQRMDDLKAQLEKCKEEYEQARREEFKEAVRRFLQEFHIETNEDLNNVAMKLRGMNPEIVKEAARNIRGTDAPAKPDRGLEDAAHIPHRIKHYQDEAPKASKAYAEAPAEEKAAADTTAKADYFKPDDLPDLSVFEEKKEPEKAEDEKELSHDEDAQADGHDDVETFFNDEPDDPEPEQKDTEPEKEADEEIPPEQPADGADVKPAEKEDNFDLDDADFDMDWDFDDDDEKSGDNDAKEAEKEAPAEAAVPQKVLSAEDIADLADRINKVALSDEQAASLRSKLPVVRAANKLLQAILTAKQELTPASAMKEIASLYDYNPEAMKNGSTRDRYKEADRLISVLDGNISEDDTPDAYPVYQEFKDFPDFVQSRAMTLVAMEIEDYFA